MVTRCLAVLVGVSLITVSAATSHCAAAEGAAGAETATLPGHSAHGDAFDEGPRRAAHLMGGTGKVHLSVTTEVPQAQQFFDQGLGQLHGFWYFEAERSFRQVAALDPDCAMAYWGMAMANVNNEKRAKSFLAEAVKRKNEKLSRYESMWVDALGAYYPAEDRDDKARRRDYVRKLEAIVQEFPKEAEPKAFLALQIWENAGKWPIGSHQSVDALLDQVFAIEPMHPAHHYRIHLWNNEKGERALASAARCGQTSPAIAHMWHMPGHIFSELKRYDDAAWQQEASARVDHANMVRDGVMPYQIHNYFHNNQWLCEDLAFVGRARDAIDLAKNLVALPRHPKYNVVTNGGSGADSGRRRLIDTLTQYELWDEYVALCATGYLDADGTPDSQLRRLRYLGVAHAKRGEKDQAAAVVATLERMAADVKGEQETAGDKAAAEATEKKEPEDKVDAAEGRARRGFRDRRREIDRSIAHVRGEVALAAKDFTKAIELLDKADLPKDALAQALLAAGDKARAETLAKEAADNSKNQVYPLASYVDVLYRCDKKNEAKAEFARLRDISAGIDLAAPIFKRLAPAAAEFGFAGDWRVPRKQPADVGERPSLDSLGPFRWHPSPAADWSLPAADGRTIRLKDFAEKGRPVVVLFYLGHGCVQCTQQLHRFAPETKRFADAGIDLVAVSTDTVADLSKSLSSAKLDGPFPFPLVSDAGLGAFRAAGAFDDFEKIPLHGAFLVDARGDVRWQDVSAQPFTDTAFLLAEAKRLLAQPAWRDGARASAAQPPPGPRAGS
jgi:peroxiredoxin